MERVMGRVRADLVTATPNVSGVEPLTAVGCGLDGRQPVRDGDGRGAAEQFPQRLLDAALRRAVEGRRGLVEHEDPWAVQQHPRDSDALTLAARQPETPLTDDGVVAVVELHDPVVDRRDSPPDTLHMPTPQAPRAAPQTW